METPPWLLFLLEPVWPHGRHNVLSRGSRHRRCVITPGWPSWGPGSQGACCCEGARRPGRWAAAWEGPAVHPAYFWAHSPENTFAGKFGVSGVRPPEIGAQAPPGPALKLPPPAPMGWSPHRKVHWTVVRRAGRWAAAAGTAGCGGEGLPRCPRRRRQVPRRALH
ncbi:hypothetical protein HJG60_009427 [Phyllostomus discolor]|uniref:Uncharacterized protein n=1 Tax=Phyllostomus discolor TaxID=89673 RepID=A0A834DCS1_9CHIR|nr:hypothetical protein HJG60_009427 [Phyllostomus discolor]